MKAERERGIEVEIYIYIERERVGSDLSKVFPEFSEGCMCLMYTSDPASGSQRARRTGGHRNEVRL
jgi:hypothetical protein